MHDEILNDAKTAHLINRHEMIGDSLIIKWYNQRDFNVVLHDEIQKNNLTALNINR